MHQVQLSAHAFELARLQAAEAGFASVDAFIEQVVLDREAEERGDFDHRFTPKVLEALDRVSAKAKAGGRTYSPDEVDEYFREKSEKERQEPVRPYASYFGVIDGRPGAHGSPEAVDRYIDELRDEW
ncbi:MAG: hypothetical protein ACOYON_10935 [Fimbriimonas sp.]